MEDTRQLTTAARGRQALLDQLPVAFAKLKCIRALHLNLETEEEEGLRPTIPSIRLTNIVGRNISISHVRVFCVLDNRDPSLHAEFLRRLAELLAQIASTLVSFDFGFIDDYTYLNCGDPNCPVDATNWPLDKTCGRASSNAGIITFIPQRQSVSPLLSRHDWPLCPSGFPLLTTASVRANDWIRLRKSKLDTDFLAYFGLCLARPYPPCRSA